jgi:putative endonuclease
MWIELQSNIIRRLDQRAAHRAQRANRRAGTPDEATHLATGIHGEREALFHLRKLGYTIVARRWRSAKLWGDVDLIGWDGAWLCFIEVKTRSQRDATPAEFAVDQDKREMLQKMAKAYLRSLPEKLRADVPIRFDVVSVYLLPSGPEFDLYRAAFGWS